MNLKKRVAAAERALPLVEEDGPISVFELVSGERDFAMRRRLGRNGVIDAVRRMRAVIELYANDPGELSDEELILDFDRRKAASENRESSFDLPS